MPPIFPNSRKLLPPMSDESPHFAISPSTNSQSSKITEEKETENPNNTTGVSCCAYNNLTLNPPFDSAMALTVLVLLTALFFMGFFSIYIRRFSDDSSIDPARRRSRIGTTTSYQPRLRGSVKGVDPATIESLPVHVYSGGVEKQEINNEMMELECAICLSEFEEKDCVKEIPYCGHVFHVECIDTWLLSHVTCPLCRTAKLFPVEEKNDVEEEGHVACGEEEGSGVGEVHENDESDTREVRLIVEMNDTWRDVEHEADGSSGMRTTECSVNGDRAVNLHRSLSF